MQLPTIDQIPAALRSRAQWVVWRNEPRDDDGKPTKVPYQARFPRSKASSKGAGTWAPVEAALACAAKHGFDGIGYVFSEDDPYAGFDFDDVLDDAGQLAPWVAEWLTQLATYVEVSPSGRGLKGIAIGKLPGSGVNAGAIELYDQGRYFAITGQRYDGYPAEPQPVNGPLDRLYALAQQMKAQRDEEREQKRQVAYALKALEGELDRVRSAPAGTRNDALNRAAFALGQLVEGGMLDEQVVVDALADAAGTNGLGIAEIRGTLRSGMRAGKQSPRELPKDEQLAETPPEATTPSGKRVNLRTGEVIDAKDAPRRVKNAGPTNYIVVDWRTKGITAAQLYRAEFAPLIWTVENILPEGAALLAGKPKSRKSWLALSLAVACARGEKALGTLGTRQGTILYLDLESNQRRMRGRLFSMVGHQMKDLNELHIYTDWPRAEAGLDALEEWMVAHPETAVVVIDVLADFRRPKDPKEDPYMYDRETVKPINEFAERHRITVLLVHHTRKMKADDVFDEISGSTGLPSAVATMWVLGRAPNGANEMVLAMRGRDLINDEPLALEWDDYTNQFVVIGGAQDALQGGERRAVLKVLSDDQEWGPKEIAEELQKPVTNVQQLIKALLSEGLLERTGRGKYVRVLRRDQKDQNDQNHQKTQNDQSLSDLDSDLLIEDQNQDQNRLALPGAENSPSDRSDPSLREHEFWSTVPPSRRTVLRLYLRSNKESDQEHAQELCTQYGLDYEQARTLAQEGT